MLQMDAFQYLFYILSASYEKMYLSTEYKGITHYILFGLMGNYITL